MKKEKKMSNKILSIAIPTVLLLCSCNSIISSDQPELQVPKAESALKIDGKLDEKEWKKAAKITGLKPSLDGKYQDKIDKVPTEVKLLWDEDNLYVAFVCLDDDILATMKKHDDFLYKEDVVEVFIDPKGDGRQYYEIQVSPNNVILDKMFVMSAAPEYTETLRLRPGFKDRWGFLEWNFKDLRTATSPMLVDGKQVGWITEIAIPAKDLTKRLKGKKLFPKTMRANFMRYDYQPDKTGKKKMIHMNWAPVQHGCPHISPGAMGYLILDP